jgi:exonuclease III
MKIIAWNIHGARNNSPVWDTLLSFHPDIALLQEVGALPAHLADTFDIVSRPAIYKTGKPQRFSTAVLVRGKILGEVPLSSEHAWVNHELEFFKGNLICCKVQPKDHEPLIAASVYSPAWAVGRERLKEVDVSQVKTKVNPDVWVTDILWAALQNTISDNEAWVVGGDCNSSETFDADWQDRNKKRFGIRSSGNVEFLERMSRLGFTECLRKANNDSINPTFRHCSGSLAHQLDHLFVSNGFFSKLTKCVVGDQSVILAQGLSDHLPIIADFRTS